MIIKHQTIQMKKSLFIAFMLLTLCSFSQDRDVKADQILHQFSSKVKSSSSLYIEFATTMTNRETGVNENNTGKGWAKGNKYYASFGELTKLSDGNKAWTILRDERSVYVTDDIDDEESINPLRMLTIWDKGYKSRYVKEILRDGKTFHLIHLYPIQPKNTPYHTISLIFNKATKQLKMVKLKGKDGTEMTYRIRKLEFNLETPDSTFVFEKVKYPGFQIIED